MRKVMLIGSYGISAAIAATMSAEMSLAAKVIAPEPVADFSQPKRRKTGAKYPHCSERQIARYRRQLAAGQIKFIKHGPRS